jgi:hypothetical protein
MATSGADLAQAATAVADLSSIPESLCLEGRAKRTGGVLWGSLETVPTAVTLLPASGRHVRPHSEASQRNPGVQGTEGILPHPDEPVCDSEHIREISDFLRRDPKASSLTH